MHVIDFDSHVNVVLSWKLLQPPIASVVVDVFFVMLWFFPFAPIRLFFHRSVWDWLWNSRLSTCVSSLAHGCNPLTRFCASSKSTPSSWVQYHSDKDMSHISTIWQKTHVSCFLFQYHTVQASFLRWQMQWLWRHHCRNCSSNLVRPQFHAQVLCGCIQELPENRKRNTPHIHIPRNLWLFAHIKSSAFVYGCALK